MSQYHAYIHYIDEKGSGKHSFSWNRTEEYMREHIARPYMKNKNFLFAGRIIRPSSIDEIAIFKSEKGFAQLVLPNGKSAIDQENLNYVASCFSKNKVKGVHLCTSYFITSPPKEEKELTITPTKPLHKKEKVFIVHGRDDKPALRLQKYLTRTLKVDAEMFEDFKEKSSSNTIIEQLEYIRDNIGYAFVIATPDDLGCLRRDIDKCRATMFEGKRNITVKTAGKILDKLNTRARQNVVFEHGLFIGALGRERVCCLLQKETKQKPSDIDGILYVGFDKSVKETFPEITEKLKKIGLVKT